MSKKSKQLYLLLSIVFVLILLSSFTFFNRLEGFQEPDKKTVSKVVYEKPTIKEDTVIEKEVVYLCGDRMVSNVPTTADLVGLDYEGLLAKFPVTVGWRIDDSIPNALTLSRLENDVCSLHQNYFHLGTYQDRLAVFSGPLGYNKTVLRIENVAIEKLPPELQEDLKLAESFAEQPLEVKDRLRKNLEFDSENSLNDAVLQLWDELDELL